MTSNHRFEKKTVLQALILAFGLALFANPIWAQDDQSEDAEADATEEEEAADLGRIMVTGSLLKREEFTSVSPMQVINAETQAKVGQLTVADILQSSTVAAGATQLNNQFNGFVVQGGTGVQSLDLRGLGSTRTLVLLNGRRPGGSGTRGAVNAFDLANIPEVAVQRAEIVLDGSSSIYGSDAVAGVANVITRRSVEGPEINVLAELPFESGGELYRIGGITGWNFEKGSVMISGQYERREALTVGDRDYLGCLEDRAWDANGNRIDREDRSVTAGQPYSGCSNLYFNTVLDSWNGGRLVPTPDGITEGPLPGYRYRNSGRYDDPDGQAYYEDVLDAPFTKSGMVINKMERINVYATVDYSFDFWGGVDWDFDFLYSGRESEAENWRQFYPYVGSADGPYYYADDPDWTPSIDLPLGRPVMPYPSNRDASIDFYYVTTGLAGVLPTANYWSWQVYATYSYSDGDYGNNAILKSLSGDWLYSDSAPTADYYDPAILGGDNMQALVNAVGVNHTGNTIYDQLQTTAILSGDLISLPAGTLGAAVGVEYRTFSIDDQPSEYSKSGDLWGSSSAISTKGSNNVFEAFGELEIPLLAGLTAVENLTLSLSGRYFDYKDGGSDAV
ncbi:MAG: TonB-dependent receptor plug domain-containing protein, partial [Gammaproteobacteria bacterium]|nr:TonB-dependent receptor plug domain-containing protein [Gammaproteobacteria bacterium]